MLPPVPTTPLPLDAGIVAIGLPEGRRPRADQLLADLTHVPESNPLRRELLIQQVAHELARRDRVCGHVIPRD